MATCSDGRALPIFLSGLGVGFIIAVFVVHFLKKTALFPELATSPSVNREAGDPQAPTPNTDVFQAFSDAAVTRSPPPDDRLSPPVPDASEPLASQELEAFLTLSAAFQAQRYEEVIRLYQSYTWVSQAGKALALYTRALGRLALTSEDYRSQALAALEAQIAQDPTLPIFYAMRAQILVDQGFVDQALAGLAAGQQWMQNASDRAVLLEAEHAVFSSHLRFLTQNRLWSEVISFAQGREAEQSVDRYVSRQLALARAHAALFEWDAANQALTQASLSAPGDTRVNSVQQKVDALYRRRQTRKVEGVDTQWFEVQAQRLGDGLVVGVRLDNGGVVNLLVDTGATISTLNQSIFEQSGAGLSAERVGARAFISASGRFEASVILLEQITVPPVSAQNIEFALISEDTPGIDGLLGMNFLKHFEFSIDVSVPELKLRLK